MIDHYFPTPIYRNTLDQTVCDKILLQANSLLKDRPEYKHDHWSTHDDMNTNALHELPEYKWIEELLYAEVNSYAKELNWKTDSHTVVLDKMWFNMYQHNQVPREHYHPGAVISGVLYLGEGHNLEFQHPALNNRPCHLFHQVWVEEENFSNHNFVFYKAEKGLLLLFPSYLIHKGIIPEIRKEKCFTMAFDFVVKSHANHQFPRS
jgi:uncharacterized protein (TIGR02466 family)